MRFIPDEVICYELGEKFGVLPWRIEQEGAYDVMRYWEVHLIKLAAQNKKSSAGQGSNQEGISSDQIHAAARSGRDY